MECGATAGVRVCTGQRGSGGWEWNQCCAEYACSEGKLLNCRVVIFSERHYGLTTDVSYNIVIGDMLRTAGWMYMKE